MGALIGGRGASAIWLAGVLALFFATTVLAGALPVNAEVIWSAAVLFSGLVGGVVQPRRTNLSVQLMLGALGTTAALGGLAAAVIAVGHDTGDHLLVVLLLFTALALMGLWVSLFLGHLIRAHLAYEAGVFRRRKGGAGGSRRLLS